MKKLIIIFLLLGSRLGFAAEVWHSAKIKAVQPLEKGSFVLKFDQDHASCTNGNTPHKYYYVEVGQKGVTEAALKNYLSVALTAAATGKPISILFESSTPACHIRHFDVQF